MANKILSREEFSAEYAAAMKRLREKVRLLDWWAGRPLEPNGETKS